MWNPEEHEAKKAFSFSGFILDPTTNDLYYRGNLVSLAPKVSACLSYLVRNQGRLVTKDELISEVWPDTFVEDNSLSYSISKLRKALAAIEPDTEFIKTVPRRGFRFQPKVDVVNSAVILQFAEKANKSTGKSDGVQEIEKPLYLVTEKTVADHQTVPAAGQGRRRYAKIFGIAGATIAAVLAIFLWSGFAPGSSPHVRSIAVMPFSSFGNTNDDKELRLRITDAIITRLGNLSHVVVRPTTSVLSFADGTVDALEKGRQLGVDAVLDGRLQQENDKLRATVQLISVKTGEQIWTARFDGTTDRLIALQDQIAEGLLARIIELQPRESSTKLTSLSTANAEAYDNYLRGRYFFEQRATEFDGSLKKAGAHFEKALEIDPNFSSATAELANVVNLQTSSGTYKREVGYKRARELALKALAANPDLPEAHVALGWVYQKYDYNFAEAERSFKRAIELNPNYVLAHLWLNINYGLQGDFENARRSVDSALSIDPANATAHSELVLIKVRNGQCNEALEFLPKLLDFYTDPARRALSKAEYESLCGRFEPAIADLEYGIRVLEERGMRPARPYVILGYAYAASGNRKKAMEVAEKLEGMKRNRNVLSGLVATYAHLGDDERMHKALDELYESGDERLLQMKVDPRYDIIRDDPKFKEILRKVNLL